MILTGPDLRARVRPVSPGLPAGSEFKPRPGRKPMAAASLAGKPRKVIPKILAVIHADGCTGCEACLEVCPVDCIYKVSPGEYPGLQAFCDIDLDFCIGRKDSGQACQ